MEFTEAMENEVARYYGLQTSNRHTTSAPQSTPSGEKTIQLKEESVQVGKREVEAGGVRLRKVVRTEVVNQPVTLEREELVVERVPASGKPASGGFDEQEIYVPLRREEAVVDKNTRVREEVRVGKRTETERQTVSETVRREDIEIDKQGGSSSPWSTHEGYWRQNYASAPYYEKGRPFEDYQGAYRTGFEGYSRYRGKTFDQVEADLRRDYERNRGSSSLTWEKVKAAARSAWDRVERALPGDADRDGR
jgi:uncharacterized protein (TIGR02271 family)